MAQQENLTVDQGSTYIHHFVSRLADNVPEDLTDFSARMAVRDGYDGKVILTLTTENGKLAITPAEGKVTVHLLPADTAVLKFEGKLYRYVYDLEIAKDADVFRLVQGTFTVSREITR